MSITRLRDVPDAIVNMRDFRGASMSGRILSPREGTYLDAGWLTAGPDLDRFLADRPTLLYVVFSYATPIAWASRMHDTPYIVEQQFSMTTSSRHMPPVLAAWGNYLPEGHRLARVAARQRRHTLQLNDVARSAAIEASTEGTLRTTPFVAMANPSRIYAGGEYPLDAIKRENAERAAQLPLTDRIAALIGD